MSKTLKELKAERQSVGTAQLTLPSGERIELPTYQASIGADVIDVGALTKFNKFTYDPGFTSTASCASTITYIDGERGQLLYRGYAIEELAEKSTFLEVCYLLYHGIYPEKIGDYKARIHSYAQVDEQIINCIASFKQNAHPMAMMMACVSSLAAIYHDCIEVKNTSYRQEMSMRLVAQMPILAALAYRHSVGQTASWTNTSDVSEGFSDHFLRMLFSTSNEPYHPDPLLVRALDRILILHADHEQNASTSTVRLVGSSNASPFASIAAGIASLWGPAHGGANEAVLNMLETIGDFDHIPDFIKAVKSGSGQRLMGFGHRVYKNYDPRANIMRQTCHQVLDHLNLQDDKTFRISLELERIALADDYFVSRNLYPNVDFYSGVVLRALGIPVNLFTVIFAVARTIGWVSHWNEQHQDPEFRIGRPRQLYLGDLPQSLTSGQGD